MISPSAVAVALALSLAVAGCVTPESTAHGCGDLRFAQPALVLETTKGAATSALGRLGVDGCLTEVADIALPNNALLRSAHGRPFVLDDDQGLLLAIDPQRLAVTGTFAAAPSTPDITLNPHDVDVDKDGRLWVPRYGQGSLALIERDGSWGGAVDLADLDPDGVPEMEAIRIQGDRAFVSVEMLDLSVFPAQPRQRGKIVILDAAPPHARLGAIDLLGSNPFGRLVPLNEDGSVVAVATPGRFDSIDPSDGIDAVDLISGKATQIIGEPALGGSVWEVAVAAPTEAYAIVLAPMDPNPTRVVRFDPTTGTVVGAPLLTLSQFGSAGIAVVGGDVLAGDFTKGKAEIHVFDRARLPVGPGQEAGAVTPKLLPPWSLLPIP